MINQENSSCKKNTTCVICASKIQYVKGVGRPSKSTCSKECLFTYKSNLADKKKIDFTCAVCQSKSRVNAKSKRVTCGKICAAKLLSTKYSGRRLPEEWKNNQNISKRAENVRKYGVYTCFDCDRSFKSNTSLRSHHATCHSKCEYGDFTCFCGMTLKSTKALK